MLALQDNSMNAALTLRGWAHRDVSITETLNPRRREKLHLVQSLALSLFSMVSNLAYIDEFDAPKTDAHWLLIWSQPQYGSLARRQSSHDV